MESAHILRIAESPCTVCNYKSRKRINDNMLFCKECCQTDQQREYKSRILDPVRNFFLISDSQITEPALQTVDRREQIIRGITRIDKTEQPVSQSLARQLGSHICRREQYKDHSAQQLRRNIR